MAKCEQCGTDFKPKNVNNKFCKRACQLDNYRGVSAEQSIKRAQTGFAWEPVRPAPKIKVSVPKRKVYPLQGWKTALIIPDQQVGYRKLPDGTLDPFHDPRAIHIVEQIAEVERPDETIMLGDLSDNPTWGKYRQEPEFVGGTQPGIDRASLHVQTISELSKRLKILSGNHDIRIENNTIDNMLASAGIRRARKPKEFPVMSMPFLLGIDEMKNVEWIGGYPAGAVYINDNLACIHGTITGTNIAEKVINTERVSVIFGHVHRYIDGMATFNHRHRPIFVRVHSPGTVARIDGHTPSTKSGRDPFGIPVTSFENWQQGLSLIRYKEGDGRFVIEYVPIFEGWAMHRGQEFISMKKVNDPELELLPCI